MTESKTTNYSYKDKATLRDKMYRDLIMCPFSGWTPEIHEKALEYIVKYREEIENVG